ncbi:MAG TPA: tRNA (N(6)-L-threonylcarbamoyladenosine(37)-C(2))-methylthiotransferase MtaB, partial [Gallicola sp.]|nr:tRNA (N(6)-L-threonylcarbamoyladenosine(37)-C(2))-methylthiotransferase MtaB [Gallicola sp.]
MKFSTHTLGCKVNLYESEAVINDLVNRGFEYGNFNDVCDVYIINTCTVTSTSDAKSRKVIRQAIRRNPKAIIVVMGCYAQLNPNEVVSLEGVDII